MFILLIDISLNLYNIFKFQCFLVLNNLNLLLDSENIMASFNFGDMEVNTVSSSTSKKRFDCIIGTIEEIVISDEFLQLQHSFMEKYYLEFEDSEENKFIYTDIFKEYGAIIEKYLVNQLKQRIPKFSMEKFAASLHAHKSEITDEIFDMFVTFTDFLAFKEMFLDYRADKEGKNIDLLGSVVVHSLSTMSATSVTTS